MTLLYNHDSFVYRYTNYWYTLDRICNYCTIQRWYKKKYSSFRNFISWSVHVLNTNANGIIFKKENKSMFQTDEWTNTSNFVNVIFCTLITKQEMQVTSIQQYTASSTSPLYCPSKKWIANSVFFLHALFIIIKLDWHARIGTFYEYSPTDKAYMLSRTWNARQHLLWYIGIWNL